MIDQSFQIAAELGLEAIVADATALLEQYEPVNDDQAPAVSDDCENLYAMPR